jgi:hypothetical protein
MALRVLIGYLAHSKDGIAILQSSSEQSHHVEAEVRPAFLVDKVPDYIDHELAFW